MFRSEKKLVFSRCYIAEQKGLLNQFSLRVAGANGVVKWTHIINCANSQEKKSWFEDLQKIIRDLNPDNFDPRFQNQGESDPFANAQKEGYLGMDLYALLLSFR